MPADKNEEDERGDEVNEQEEEVDEDANAVDGALEDALEVADEGDEEDEDMNPLAHLPDYVVKRVEKLQLLHEQREAITEQYLTERAQLEKKFEALYQPIYDERASIVRGEKDDEIAKEAQSSGDSKAENAGAEESAAAVAGGGDDPDGQRVVAGIPQFWACAMTQNETIGELVTEEDVDCLEYLQNVTCDLREDGKGFTLSFTFALNDYFTNTMLTKEYEVPNMLLSDEPLLKNVKGTKIHWKSGRSLTHRTFKKKQRGKGRNAGQLRTVTKTEEKESFFHWFTPPEMPPMESMDEEEAAQLEEEFDTDYEIAQEFRNNIIPKAVLWFMGKASDDELNHVIGEMVDEHAEEEGGQ